MVTQTSVVWWAGPVQKYPLTGPGQPGHPGGPCRPGVTPLSSS